MLSNFLGRSPIELLKSAVIVVLALLLAVSLELVASVREGSVPDQQQRQQVLDTARAFAVALTTYDYAHPEVQEQRLNELATPGAVAKARAAQTDIVRAKASATGVAAEAFVQNFSRSRAAVLIRTSQIIQNIYTSPGTQASGLLRANLEHRNGSWRVTAFEWLSTVEEVTATQR